MTLFIFLRKKRLFWNSKTSYKNDNWRFYEEYCPNQKILLGENSFANFPCKTVVFRASTRIFQQVIIAWIWFLILVKPEVTYFWKMKISKKGRGRNVYLKWRGDYMKKYEFHLRSWYYSLVLWYIWSNPIFGNVVSPFTPSFYDTSGALTFIFKPPVENYEFSPFL